jgi:hypothetical protein
MTVELEMPELPLLEPGLLLPAALGEGLPEGVDESATTTMLVMTWPPEFVVTRAEVTDVGGASLVLAASEDFAVVVAGA